MDSSTETDARDEEREENMEQISSDSSIGPSEQCNVFEIPTTSEVSHKSNCDSAIDSSKETYRSELPISSENWDSIDDTLNQDVDDVLVRFSAFFVLSDSFSFFSRSLHTLFAFVVIVVFGAAFLLPEEASKIPINNIHKW
ncbi:hypothetical protein L6452_02263 [Arctium lappa]|uniref:Uncharacterized protein n=1 Tax=Arctium lappa TaxID=4217 RepID=A0ACB9FIX2_ARCLA|nr:hypothetical protein L6452_02263 [Arctium lappa]